MEVPEWFSLVFKPQVVSYNHTRWALFDWTFDLGPKFTTSLRNLSTTNLAVVLVTLKYLLQVIENSLRLTRNLYQPNLNPSNSKMKSALMRLMHFSLRKITRETGIGSTTHASIFQNESILILFASLTCTPKCTLLYDIVWKFVA